MAAHETGFDRETRYLDLRALPRHFPSRLPVRAIGYLRQKRQQVRKTADRLSFCFILKGSGEFRLGRRAWAVRAPAVLVQRPGQYVEHGPAGAWEELYVNYAREVEPAFDALHLLHADLPVWQAHDAALMRRGVDAVLDAMGASGRFGGADRIDRLCEQLVLESLIAEIAPPAAENELSVRGARAYLERCYNQPINFDQLALDYGMSPADFRRKWRGLMPLPPGKYLVQLRMREACRLLVESGDGIGEIAAAVGFGDPLYFARAFKRLTGRTASDYRAQHRA